MWHTHFLCYIASSKHDWEPIRARVTWVLFYNAFYPFTIRCHLNRVTNHRTRVRLAAQEVAGAISPHSSQGFVAQPDGQTAHDRRRLALRCDHRHAVRRFHCPVVFTRINSNGTPTLWDRYLAMDVSLFDPFDPRNQLMTMVTTMMMMTNLVCGLLVCDGGGGDGGGNGGGGWLMVVVVVGWWWSWCWWCWLVVVVGGGGWLVVVMVVVVCWSVMVVVVMVVIVVVVGWWWSWWLVGGGRGVGDVGWLVVVVVVGW